MIYSEAQALIRRGRSGYSYRLPGRNGSTWLNQRREYIAVTLHRTDVVQLYPDGSVRLSTGGWNTVTTRTRINEYNPHNGYAYTTCNIGLYFDRKSGKSYKLDGLKITAEGKVIGTEVDVTELQRQRRRELYQERKRERAQQLLNKAPHLKTELGRALEQIPVSKVEAALSTKSNENTIF
jgi:hypothetical protein